MYRQKLYLSIIVLLFLASYKLFAQSDWYYGTSVQMLGTESTSSTNHNSFLFYNGLRYQSERYTVGVNVPVVFSSESTNDEFTLTQNNSDSGHMNGGLDNLKINLGDIYIFGNYQLNSESSSLPAFSLESYIQFPTSTKSELFSGIGTDVQIALGVSKSISNLRFFGQFGYLFLGNNSDSNLNNPFTFSVGVGYLFPNRKYSILFAYDSYSKIIDAVDAPSQAAVGLNVMLNQGLFLTSFVSAGLSNSSLDYTISGGVNVKL